MGRVALRPLVMAAVMVGQLSACAGFWLAPDCLWGSAEHYTDEEKQEWYHGASPGRWRVGPSSRGSCKETLPYPGKPGGQGVPSRVVEVRAGTMEHATALTHTTCQRTGSRVLALLAYIPINKCLLRLCWIMSLSHQAIQPSAGR